MLNLKNKITCFLKVVLIKKKNLSGHWAEGDDKI